jgi:hypothetical protein
MLREEKDTAMAQAKKSDKTTPDQNRFHSTLLAVELGNGLTREEIAAIFRLCRALSYQAA